MLNIYKKIFIFLKMKNINEFITKKIIPYDTKLKYLITIPCVNREERNAINVIDKTFESFEKSGLFNELNINLKIILFESGSKNISYLDFIESYKTKYSVNIEILYNSVPLNGNTNTFKMFKYISNLPKNLYDFIIWMDDDVFVCNNFIKNADAWIKKFANFSIFSSLYVPYESYPILNRKFIHLSRLHTFYGTCCTIFKPELAKYVIPTWFDYHFERFAYNPDTRFRDSVKKQFPQASNICVSFPSFVEHMNIGSAIRLKKKVNKGHKAKFFIGEDKDPKLYLEFIENKVNNENI
jgi:hypothetical protein